MIELKKPGEFKVSDNIMRRIKTFEDACEVLNISTNLPDVSSFPEDQQLSVIAGYKLKIIIKALNEGWKPDWTNSNEMKWRPWFNLSSFGFSLSYYDYVCTLTSVSSRLCFKSEELSDYCATTFLELYKDYLN